MSDLNGRTIVVTGGGAGLGATYCRTLGALGASVIVSDIVAEGPDGSGASAIARQITESGGRAEAAVGSVTDARFADALVAQAVNAFSRVDAVVCNAGIVRDKSFKHMTPELFDQVLDVHLYGTLHLVKAAWPVMVNAGYGRVVLTTSHAGLYGNFGQTNYAAAKMALVGLMNGLAVEGSKHDVLINAIAPVAATPMTSAGLDESLQRKLDPGFPAALVAYLVSECCRFSGDVLTAAAGHYGRAAMYESTGVDVTSVPTLDDMEQLIDAIRDMSDAHDGKLTNFGWRK